MLQHYYAVAERGQGTTWWISFPGRDGITSAADEASEIVGQAQAALSTVLRGEPPGNILPPSIEAGAKPPSDLSDYDSRLVVVIPFNPITGADAA